MSVLCGEEENVRNCEHWPVADDYLTFYKAIDYANLPSLQRTHK